MCAEAVLPLTGVRFGREGLHLLVRVQGSKGHLHLLLDTGATHSMLHRDALPAIGNRGSAPGAALSDQPSLQVTGLQGSQPTSLLRLRGLRIGAVPIPPTPWGIADLSALRLHNQDRDTPPPDGLLGCDLLKRLQAVIDLEHNTLRVRRAATRLRPWQRGHRLR